MTEQSNEPKAPGMSRQAALAYLDRPEGQYFLKKYVEKHLDLAPEKVERRVIDIIMNRRQIEWLQANYGDTRKKPAPLTAPPVWPSAMPIPQPPVPEKIRELLKDYPELIYEVQKDLNDLVSESLHQGYPHPSHVFEKAIWTLEDGLDAYCSEARQELEAAEASGDSQAIERAKKKELQVDLARLRGTRSLKELSDYFDAYQRAFK